ncbi:MAG: aldehyde dehydrogenase family protein, partial [Telluria sp.]
TEVAQLINKTLARRAAAESCEIPLIAETGGQNALIVDSSALPEQVVQDALISAFDSAGQRCSALRVLFLQEEIADKTIRMLKGAMQELRVGVPDRLSTDIGPVIDAEARDNLLAHIERTQLKAKSFYSLPLPEGLEAQGTFVAPTMLEIGALSELTHEVFGPVLHIIRYQRAALPQLIESINTSGFGLTLGVHSRIDETIDFIAAHAHVGNIYINRNIVGAVVGVQPFGGEGKSGTGPKAGGPLYIKRLQRAAPPLLRHERQATPGLDALMVWARTHGQQRVVALAEQYMRTTLLGTTLALPGPTGERNTLSFANRGTVLCASKHIGVLLNQLAAVLATGNRAVVLAGSGHLLPEGLPPEVRDRIQVIANIDECTFPFQVALVEASVADTLRPKLAGRDGAIISMVDTTEEGAIPLWRLVAERALCVNTTAAGGNASLMTLGL